MGTPRCAGIQWILDLSVFVLMPCKMEVQICTLKVQKP